MGDGRLTAARRADDTERLAGTDLEADIVQRRARPFAVLVRKIHVLEPDHAIGQIQCRGAGFVLDRRVHVQKFEHPPAGHKRPGGRVHDHAHLAHRLLEYSHEGQEFRQGTDGDLTLDDFMAADPKYQAHGPVVGKGHKGGVGIADLDTTHGQDDGGLRGLIELRHFEGPGGKGADHADAAEVFLHDAGKNRHAFLQGPPSAPQGDAGNRRPPRDHRDEGQRQHAQERIGADQVIAAVGYQDDQHDCPQHGAVDEPADAFDVKHATGHQIARMDAVVIGEAHALELLEISEA